MVWIKQIGRFLLLLLLQPLLINNLQFLGVCHPYIYIFSLLVMPITLPRWADMLIGGAVGLLLDMFCNSLGVHIAACIMLMYVRPHLIGAYVLDRERLTDEINVRSLGVVNFVKYTILLVLLHHTMVFFLTAWSVQHFWFTLLEVVVSSIISILLLIGADLLRNR